MSEDRTFNDYIVNDSFEQHEAQLTPGKTMFSALRSNLNNQKTLKLIEIGNVYWDEERDLATPLGHGRGSYVFPELYRLVLRKCRFDGMYPVSR